MLLSEGDSLLPEHFPVLAPRAHFSQGVELPGGGLDLEQLERDLVVQALTRTGGNQTRAAGLLGLNRDQIRYRIEKFGLKF
jgi:two-component system NtrC family response regulator